MNFGYTASHKNKNTVNISKTILKHLGILKHLWLFWGKIGKMLS